MKVEPVEKQERKNKRIAWAISIGTQFIMLLLFYLLIAWKEPFPPIPEYGIELGFESTSAPSTPPAPVATDSSIPEVSETPVEDDASNQEVSEPIEEVIEYEDLVEETDETQSPNDTVEEVEEINEEQESSEEVTPNESQELSEVQEDTVSKEVVEETNEIDVRALYGNQSSNDSEGASLSLSGWIWDFKPEPEDTSDETGKIVYKITVDNDGFLVGIELETSTISPSVERKYRQAVQSLTFTKTSEYQPASLSTGKITFIIKAR